MERLTGERSVEQVNKGIFTNFSQCYYYFYFSMGFICLFYKRISGLFSNEYPKRIRLTES